MTGAERRRSRSCCPSRARRSSRSRCVEWEERTRLGMLALPDSFMLWPMPGYGSRYWAERTGSARRRTFPKLKGEQTADVVVIGGGLTGCTAAYALAAAGLD